MTMSVPMMEVRVVWMPVDQADVPMPVFMFHRLVKVLVLVPLGQMQP